MTINELNPAMQDCLRRYVEGLHSRVSVANWAVNQLRLFKSDQFDASAHGLLIEYVLGRMIDDDWTPEAEYIAEMNDLLTRLITAQNGEVVLP